mgnify:CR=1 FL=1
MNNLIMCALMLIVMGVSGCGGFRIVIEETPRVTETDTVVTVDPPVIDYRYRSAPRDNCWRHRGCYGVPYHGYYYGYGPFYPYYPW